MVDQLVREARGAQEIADATEYIKLARLQKSKGKLSVSEAKRMNRVRSRLLKVGLIQPINRKQLESVARATLREMPWWRRVLLRFRYFKWRFQEWLKEIKEKS
jgi:hypothetical protein